MKRPLFIYGAGGLGSEILSMLQSMERRVEGFIDDIKPAGSMVNDVPVVGDYRYLDTIASDIEIVVALGDPVAKAVLVHKLTKSSLHFPTIIHPSVIIQDQRRVSLGTGVVICAGCIITTNVIIGRHVLLNLNTTAGHDCEIGDFSSVMPGTNLAGGVKVGSTVLIGSGSNIRNNVQLGDNCVVGMGSVVLNDVASGETVAGVPAKKISR